MEYELREKEDKVSELRHALASLDKDHDTVVAEVNEKSETIAGLKRELEEGASVLSEEKNRVAQLEGEVAHWKGQLEQRVKELSELRSQLEGGGREVGELREQCATLLREKTRLTDDLSTMTQVSRITHSHSHTHMYTHSLTHTHTVARNVKQYAVSCREHWERRSHSLLKFKSMLRVCSEQRRPLLSRSKKRLS